MKLLCFQAKRFRWKTHSKTLAEVPDQQIEQEVAETLVVFLHAETADVGLDREKSVLRQTLKHVRRSLAAAPFQAPGDGAGQPADIVETIVAHRLASIISQSAAGTTLAGRLTSRVQQNTQRNGVAPTTVA